MGLRVRGGNPLRPTETDERTDGILTNRGIFYCMDCFRIRAIFLVVTVGAVCLAGCSTVRLRAPLDLTATPLSPSALREFYQKEAGIRPAPVLKAAFHDGGPAIKAEMLRLVSQAKDYILVDSFLLTDGPESREVLDALAKKAGEGVGVYVIGDSSSRFIPEKQAFDYLKERGVPVAEFNPIRGWRLARGLLLLERDHRKFWIIDGRHVFLGGANVTDSSLMSPEVGGNRDLMLTLDSREAARDLTQSFVETWNESMPLATLNAADFGKGDPALTTSNGFWFFNQEKVLEKPSSTEIVMDGLFASACNSVWLVEPYAFTNPWILSKIRKMTMRGVEVNVVLSSQVRAPRFRYASFYGIKDLTEAGARVWIFDEATPLHYKCALVDDDLAYVGSANLNLRSYYFSRELNVVFTDPSSVDSMREVIDSVLRGCRRVTAEEAAKYRSLPFLTWWLVMQGAG